MQNHAKCIAIDRHFLMTGIAKYKFWNMALFGAIVNDPNIYRL